MKDYKKLQNLVMNTNKEVLKSVVSSIDGHTIYDPKQFTEQGLDQQVVDAFTELIHSGESPKEKIYTNDGKCVKSLKGVYGLTLLKFIAGVFGVTSWKMGRGSHAEHLKEQLIENNFDKI